MYGELTIGLLKSFAPSAVEGAGIELKESCLIFLFLFYIKSFYNVFITLH